MRSKITITVILTLAVLSGAVLEARARQFGIGLVLLDPSGLTAKAWLGRNRAIDAAVGWSEWRDHYLHIQADYLFFDRRLTGDRNLDLDGYIGIGGKLIFRDDAPAWFRVPLGLDFKFRNAPLNFFFEVAPAFNFDTVRMTGAVGLRYLFGS